MSRVARNNICTRSLIQIRRLARFLHKKKATFICTHTPSQIINKEVESHCLCWPPKVLKICCHKVFRRKKVAGVAKQKQKNNAPFLKQTPSVINFWVSCTYTAAPCSHPRLTAKKNNKKTKANLGGRRNFGATQHHKKCAVNLKTRLLETWNEATKYKLEK